MPAAHPPRSAHAVADGQACVKPVDVLRGLVADERGAPNLKSRCARRSRERAYLVDATRLYHKSLVRMAMSAPALGSDAPAQTWPGGWIAERIDEALHDLLVEDEVAEAAGAVPDEHCQHDDHLHDDHWKGSYVFLTHWFGIEAGMARTSAVRFNGLAEPTRRTFFALFVEERGFEDCSSRGLGSRDSMHVALQSAFQALLFLPSSAGGAAGKGGTR